MKKAIFDCCLLCWVICFVSTMFTALQFNILAGNLASAEHFPYVQTNYLDWNARRERVASYVLSHDPDVFCLEELNDYWGFFGERFRNSGFASVYLRRPSINAPPESWSGKYKYDGCGVFWRAERFEFIEEQSVNYA